jgi:phage baseplate assembly protein W
MADLSLAFGGDLVLSPTGDLAVSDGALLTQERSLRRLLTNPGSYIWQLSYGAGLAQFVGQPGAPAVIQAVARSQMLAEATVSNDPPPVITAASSGDTTVSLTVRFTDAPTQQTSSLSFSV